MAIIKSHAFFTEHCRPCVFFTPILYIQIWWFLVEQNPGVTGVMVSSSKMVAIVSQAERLLGRSQGWAKVARDCE